MWVGELVVVRLAEMHGLRWIRARFRPFGRRPTIRRSGRAGAASRGSAPATSKAATAQLQGVSFETPGLRERDTVGQLAPRPLDVTRRSSTAVKRTPAMAAGRGRAPVDSPQIAQLLD
jgi:hypothetical protein